MAKTKQSPSKAPAVNVSPEHLAQAAKVEELMETNRSRHQSSGKAYDPSMPSFVLKLLEEHSDLFDSKTKLYVYLNKVQGWSYAAIYKATGAKRPQIVRNSIVDYKGDIPEIE